MPSPGVIQNSEGEGIAGHTLPFLVVGAFSDRTAKETKSMCIDPGKISDVGFVACRKCWQCKETRIDDWVGRCVAESKTAKAAHVVTLTYGHDLETGDTDNIRAAVLTYSDIQKYLKHLRVDKFPLRYFVVGEYGSKKQRAHWHIIIYWLERVPWHKLRQNFKQKHWPHGWSYWDKATAASVRYACKYLQKDENDNDLQGWGPMVSKYPPLGDAYFRELARQYVDQGLSPQTLHYSFADVRRNPNGFRAKTRKQYMEGARPVQFYMHGKTAANFLQSFLDQWDEVHGTVPPKSKLLDKLNVKPARDDGFARWLLKKGYVREELAKEDERKFFDQYLETQPILFERKARIPVTKPVTLPEGGTPAKWHPIAKAWFSEVGAERLFYSTDEEGNPVWHVDRNPKNADAVSRQSLRRRSLEKLSQGSTRVRPSREPRQEQSEPRLSYRDLSKGL